MMIDGDAGFCIDCLCIRYLMHVKESVHSLGGGGVGLGFLHVSYNAKHFLAFFVKLPLFLCLRLPIF